MQKVSSQYCDLHMDSLAKQIRQTCVGISKKISRFRMGKVNKWFDISCMFSPTDADLHIPTSADTI